MSSVVPGRWIAASRWSGGFDFRPVLEQLGGPNAFLKAPLDTLAVLGFSQTALTALRDTPEATSPDPWTHLGAPDYPSALLDLACPPPVVWLRGDATKLSLTGVAVVGTRTCTAYGHRMARRIGAAVARAGGAVISGAARGIDASAHLGAAGQTVAVLGAGLAAPASRAALELRESVLEAGGLLISELAPREPAARWTFPRRNRLIAALARRCVVVEAGDRSGALITAEQAASLGRAVYAVPGPMDAPASAGALGLIAAGAACLSSLEPLIAGLAPDRSAAARLRHALSSPAGAAEVARRAGLGLQETLIALASLELTLEVRRLPDQRYALR